MSIVPERLRRFNELPYPATWTALGNVEMEGEDPQDMGYVDWLCGGHGVDPYPDSVDPIISEFVQKLSVTDVFDAARVTRFRELLPQLVDTVYGDREAVQRRRIFVIADWSARTIAPLAIGAWIRTNDAPQAEVVGLHGDLCSLEPLDDAATVEAALRVVRRARAFFIGRFEATVADAARDLLRGGSAMDGILATPSHAVLDCMGGVYDTLVASSLDRELEEGDLIDMMYEHNGDHPQVVVCDASVRAARAAATAAVYTENSTAAATAFSSACAMIERMTRVVR